MPSPSHLVRPLFAVMAVVFGLCLLDRSSEPTLARDNNPDNPKLDFGRQIRPLLSEYCFACHGPDEKQRKAKLRLDTQDGMFGKRPDGSIAVQPGNLAASLLIDRITTEDPELRMPPTKTGKQLTAQQVELLKRWVREGANWQMHWAFTSPKRPAAPQVSNPAWVRNAIDSFILARLDAERIQPSPEASRTALIRRVTLDLTGLPPTTAEVDAFLADPSPRAYEQVVDRLLDSSRYGEHMARSWLDASRYGDTHGLHLDNYREIWPYRDWVIHAFNQNLPYDRFLSQQLAGDLLPNPTTDEILATGFNRCHVTTSEGGSIEEEVYVRNVADQVDTNGSVILGLSVGCARCHDHKFDPITAREYYQLFAFFNSIDGSALDGNSATHAPVLKVSTPAQAAALKSMEEEVAALRKLIQAEAAMVNYEEPASSAVVPDPKPADFVWIEDGLPQGTSQVAGGGINVPWNIVGGPAHQVHSGEKSFLLTGTALKQFVFDKASPGLEVGQGDKLFAYVYLDPRSLPKEIMLQWHTASWSHRAYWGTNAIDWGKDNSSERLPLGGLPEAGKWVRLEVEAEKVGIRPGVTITGWAFTIFDGAAYWDHAGIVTSTPQGNQPVESLSAWIRKQKGAKNNSLPKDIQDALKLDPAKHTDAQKQLLRDHFITHVYPKTRPIFQPLLKRLAEAEKARGELEKQIPTSLVFRERKDPRPAFVLHRGEYDQRREQVSRDTPAFLPPFPTDAPRNRLGLAKWLTQPNHPLTARVAVNRFWQQTFGTGLVRTADDFGSQGEPPSHPELLDWLAIDFVENGWDVKRLMRLLVTSATYRQSAKLTPDVLARDPQNRLLARAPRYRLEAEMLRDQALFVSGLLHERVGGPSVKPPQPAGIWEAVGYTSSNTARFVADTGREKVHRRSLYTFWKRTAAPPQMTTLDAPSREACTIRRERTNTPLQALLLMNEPQFIECARVLAEKAIKNAGSNAEERAGWIFRQATSRQPNPAELSILMAAARDHLAEYAGDHQAAKKLIEVGESKADPQINPCELAAWTMVANLVLNLDEVLNK